MTRRNVPLSRYTSARVGGAADSFLTVHSADELAEAVSRCWEQGVPFMILGGGSNVLVSDAGVRGLVIHNRSRRIRFDLKAQPPAVWAESGANFGGLARQTAAYGSSGLEWAAAIPGTVGGAVVGNAGAHGSEVAGSLLMAEILHREQEQYSVVSDQESVVREEWPAERLEFGYRTSLLKAGQTGRVSNVVLSARFRLERSAPEAVQAKIDELTAHRRRTQPPGASMGSMFKNPPGDYAGRLIEAAGLKGTRIGDAEISPSHANFFVNRGRATASDIYSLLQLAQRAVKEKFGVELELEIELVGEW